MLLKGMTEKTQKNYMKGGFTLLEIIVVLSIMSFLAAMIVPFIGHMNNTQKTKDTHEILRNIRTAIIGTPNVFDSEGIRIIGGYVKDMDAFPKLYEAEWDNTNKVWKWKDDDEEVVNGRGQPRGLWEEGRSLGSTDLTEDAPDYSSWKGPYLYYPKDPYPENTKELEKQLKGVDELDDLDPDDKGRFEQRYVEGKLSDAWGRVLYFIKQDTAEGPSLLMISAGPSGKIVLPDPGEKYNQNADKENEDNIVLEIKHREWYNLAQRTEATYEILENIRTAIIGPQNVYDREGIRVIGGYVRDMNTLPKLYEPIWNKEGLRWDWDEDKEEVEIGKGQPRGLWEAGLSLGDPDLAEDVPDYSRWLGPYIDYPREDPFPDDTKNLLEELKKSALDRLDGLDEEDKKRFQQRHVGGKLSDAWGEALYFIKEGSGNETSLLMISAGADGEIILPDPSIGDTHYDKDAVNPEGKGNKDNIVIKITPNEWYEPRNIGKEEETMEILQELRRAIIGRVDAIDAMGRKNVGGYIGDIGDWPKLYYWDDDFDDPSWIEFLENDYEELYGQPIYLWKKKTDPLWKGPYITEPWGIGGNQLIRDAWNNEIYFEIDRNSDGNEYLRITSPGIDGNIDTEDDLYIDIFDYEWKSGDIAMMDKKKIEDTIKILERVREAFLGADAFDASGRRIVGGYLGDMGDWPTFTNISSSDGITEYQQPQDLWKIKEGAGQGFEWRGPYIQKPIDVLRDAWGKPIHFELNENENRLIIISGGADGKVDLDADDNDDIARYIDKSEWKVGTITVRGNIYNESYDPKEITVKLHHKPKGSKEKVITVPGRSETGPGYHGINLQVEDVVCGKRNFEIIIEGEKREIDIFIGIGGTQSPTKERLNFYIKRPPDEVDPPEEDE
ncbi:prepilin-type N-terminal cleavage/methylation domain-containing protein [Clostridium aceticum]|uniref:Prepilin-type N-terminal cleavage/methylation domain-containing protein n=2 Tax=Clostridium aceticum TaxID=84022 RepID=A0A0D8IA94_9CLOT|nr:prepilin-type N-terminal cleavage/methylation domain-containing protein [Clostridium aceticum]KJF26942.1 hypothetical protein TZ02_10430 [Clostridium aceticum]